MAESRGGKYWFTVCTYLRPKTGISLHPHPGAVVQPRDRESLESDYDQKYVHPGSIKRQWKADEERLCQSDIRIIFPQDGA